MKIEKNSIVSVHYTLTAEDGSLIDTSVGDEPLLYLAASGHVIPGLDNALMGLIVGDKKQVVVQPAEGYGPVYPDLIQELPRVLFEGVEKIEVGMEFQTEDSDGEAQYVIVTGITDENITVDGNHDLAGMVLSFDVSIEAIREATPEEIDHGHVH
ncbi:MAG: FKBP-type peptidyl-prolyl cis-trans isomerase SlyD [Lentisphaeria bacterium]